MTRRRGDISSAGNGESWDSKVFKKWLVGRGAILSKRAALTLQPPHYRSLQPGFEKFFHSSKNLCPVPRLIDRLSEPGASRDAMREPGRELLHFALGSRHFFFQEHLEISANHLIAIGFVRFVIHLLNGSDDAVRNFCS